MATDQNRALSRNTIHSLEASADQKHHASDKTKALKVLFLAPYCDGQDVGESYHAHRWAEQLSKYTDATVLSLHRRGQAPTSEQLPRAKTRSWTELPFAERMERFNALAKPSYWKFYYHARRWIKRALASGQHFDIIHQMTPSAPRYPSPGVGFGIPLVHGPLQGSIETPKGFARACSKSSPWYMKLRRLDKWRLAYDPWLRNSYQNTSLILVGSAYMEETLSHAGAFQVRELIHLTVDGIVPHAERTYRVGQTMRLLHVGRLIRTKGLIDTIRALSEIKDQNRFTLDVIGEGDQRDRCISESKRLGLEDRVFFHGKLPRQEVESFYAQCHAMVFPSFREPAGGVVLEALRHGLPVIAADIGGPATYITQDCGFRVSPVNPSQFARDLSSAIEQLIRTPGLHEKLQRGAYQRALEIGDPKQKMAQLLDLYRELLDSSDHRGSSNSPKGSG